MCARALLSRTLLGSGANAWQSHIDSSGLCRGRLQYKLDMDVRSLFVKSAVGRHLHGHTQSIFSVRGRYEQVGVGLRHSGRSILLDALFAEERKRLNVRNKKKQRSIEVESLLYLRSSFNDPHFIYIIISTPNRHFLAAGERSRSHVYSDCGFANLMGRERARQRPVRAIINFHGKGRVGINRVIFG